jgi:hypothetical protein
MRKYLPFSETKIASSIETHICEKMHNAIKIQMDEEESRLLITLILADNIELPEGEKPFLYKLIEKRINNCFTYTLDSRAIMFLCIISKNAGNAVMYMWYLQYWSHKKAIKHISLELFCEIFPIGFISDSDLLEIWDGQKVDSDRTTNLVDYLEAGNSIKNNKL